ncbi:MAG: hypothetical protein OXJ52_07260 [Oligoflexia bacterium]|nr:hypothetical protein [Oligoflexia bacterium]
MKNNNVQLDQQFLKKLKRKAELCRFAHSELKAEYKVRRNLKEFSILILSVILVALINLYYRKLLEGDHILLLLWVLPLLTTIIQALDHTVFQWTNKAGKHESAVTIWGHWLREADFLEKHIHRYTADIMNEKIQHIQEKYNSCMNSTNQIPNNKFLKYKKRFKMYVLKSQAIDEMFLKDIENKK